MLTIQIDATKLAAVSHFSASRGVRYYLNGVLIEADPKETRLVATDGHALAAARADADNAIGDRVSIIVPSDTVTHIAKGAGFNNGIASLEFSDDTWKAHYGDRQTISFSPIDGRFPEWRAVIPSSDTGEVAQFDPALLVRFVKAAKSLRHPKAPVLVQHNGNSGALVTLGDVNDFLGVVMPLNSKKLGAVALTGWART